MNKILVTGGVGFLGSHLCKLLVDTGNYVICLDNFFTGVKKNIKELLSSDRFELIEHDIIDPIDINYVDQIYNLACPASPIHYQYDPLKTLLTSTVGIYHVLELARKCGARILQASTSEIYGDPLVYPQSEDYKGNVNTLGARACYDEGKRCAETCMMDYFREHNVDIRIARIFNTYGPNMNLNDGRVVSNFIVQALRGEDITIYGDGTQTRSFCYIADTITALYNMMEQGDFIGPVNIGNPNEVTIKELACLVIDKIGESKLVYKDLPEDDPLKRKPDISLAKEKLMWSPEINLKEGLDYTIEYFKRVLS